MALCIDQDTLWIDQMTGFSKLSEDEKTFNAISSESIFSIRTYYAGAGAYYYGLLKMDTLEFWRVDFTEEGDRFEKESIRRFEKVDKYWIEQSIPKIKNKLDYRNQNWNPETGAYYFSEQYVYRFLNNRYSEGDFRREGTFSFFLDAVSGTVLLRSGDSYWDEMTAWILIRPHQDYIVSYSHEHGPNSTDTIPRDPFLKQYANLYQKDVQRSFQTFFKPIPKTKKSWGGGKYSIDSLWAQNYWVQYPTRADSTVLSLAKTSHDWTLLNLLYKSDALPEGGLLIPITGVELPKNLLIVQDQSLGSGYESHFYLEGIHATSHFLKIEPNKK
ncbi:MAG: hypothetical protein VW080_09440 [Flavobacteriaceae bacterium]